MLENGSIIRNQVTYDSLTPADWGVLENPEAESPLASEEAENGAEQQSIVRRRSPSRPIELGLTEADMARQTGDSECYRIYLGSLGWKVVTTSLFLMVAHAVLEVMPRTFPLSV